MCCTKVCIFIVIFCNINQFSASKNEPALSQDTLQAQYGIIDYACLIFRHGDRTPVLLYPTDPYQNYAWPVDLGQLTNDGKKREFELGRYFEPRYNCITGGPYLPTRVIMDAADVDRCLMSGELFFAGYYPPSGAEIWNQHLLWQPIPVHTTPKVYDLVIEMSKPCPRLNEAETNFFATSPIIKNICNIYRNMFIYIQKYSGLNMTPCESLQTIMNTIIIQDTLLVESQQLNLTLPEWTKAVFPEPLTYLRGFLMGIELEDPTVKRLLAGPLLNVLASDMLNIAGLNNTLPQILYTSNPSQTRPLHLISGHDSTVVAMLRVLGVYNNVSPPYGSAIGFELRSRDNTHYVTVVYENSTKEPLGTLEVPGCLGSCTLANFLSLIVPLIPPDWEAECLEPYVGPTTWTPPLTKPTTSNPPTTVPSPSPTYWPTEPTIWTPPSLTPPIGPPTGWIPPAKPPNGPSVVVVNNPNWTINQENKKQSDNLTLDLAEITTDLSTSSEE